MLIAPFLTPSHLLLVSYAELYRKAMYTAHLAIGMLMVDFMFIVSPELRVRPSMCPLQLEVLRQIPIQ